MINKNNTQKNERNILAETPLGRFINWYDYKVRHLGEEIDKEKPAKDGKQPENTYTSLCKACKGRTGLNKENKAYIVGKLKCSLEELNVAIDLSKINFLISKRSQTGLDKKEEKHFARIKSELSNLVAGNIGDALMPSIKALLPLLDCTVITQEKPKLAPSPKVILPHLKYGYNIYDAAEEKGFVNNPYANFYKERKNIDETPLIISPLNLNSVNFNLPKKPESSLIQNNTIDLNEYRYQGVNKNASNMSDEELIAQGHVFKVLFLKVDARYHPDMSFGWTKFFRIVFLIDGVTEVEGIDFYDVQGEPVSHFCCSNGLSMSGGRRYRSTSDFIHIKLHEPSRRGQVLDIVIHYFCPRLLEGDNTFAGTWVRFPTYLLQLDFTPPTPKVSTDILQFRSLEDYLQLQQPVNLGSLQLNPVTGSFQTRLPNPEISLLKLPWGE